MEGSPQSPGPNIKQGNFLTSKQILETGCWSINFSLLNTFQFRFTKDYLLDARFVLTNISIALCAGEWRCWHIDLSLFPSSLKFPNWQSLHQTFQVFIQKFKCGRELIPSSQKSAPLMWIIIVLKRAPEFTFQNSTNICLFTSCTDRWLEMLKFKC